MLSTPRLPFLTLELDDLRQVLTAPQATTFMVQAHSSCFNMLVVGSLRLLTEISSPKLKQANYHPREWVGGKNRVSPLESKMATGHPSLPHHPRLHLSLQQEIMFYSTSANRSPSNHLHGASAQQLF